MSDQFHAGIGLAGRLVNLGKKEVKMYEVVEDIYHELRRFCVTTGPVDQAVFSSLDQGASNAVRNALNNYHNLNNPTEDWDGI